MRISYFISFCLLNIVLSISSLCILADSYAAGPRAQLQAGMSKSEVQALWGEPKETTDFDLQNKSVWFYPEIKYSKSAKLVFQGDVLTSILRQEADLLSNAGSSKLVVNSKSENKKELAKTFMAVEDPEVLNEILNEVPSEPDSPKSKSADTAPVAPGQAVE